MDISSKILTGGILWQGNGFLKARTKVILTAFPFFKNSILHQSEELCRKAKIINGANWTATVRHTLGLLEREASESNSHCFLWTSWWTNSVLNCSPGISKRGSGYLIVDLNPWGVNVFLIRNGVFFSPKHSYCQNIVFRINRTDINKTKHLLKDLLLKDKYLQP